MNLIVKPQISGISLIIVKKKIIDFHPKIIVIIYHHKIKSQNIIPDDMKKSIIYKSVMPEGEKV